MDQKEYESDYMQPKSILSGVTDLIEGEVHLCFCDVNVKLRHIEFFDEEITTGVFSAIFPAAEESASIPLAEFITFLASKVSSYAKWIEENIDAIHAAPVERLEKTTTQELAVANYDSACALMAMLGFFCASNIKKTAPHAIELVLQNYSYGGKAFFSVDESKTVEDMYKSQNPPSEYENYMDADYTIKVLTKQYKWYTTGFEYATTYNAECEDVLEALYVALRYCVTMRYNVRQCSQCSKYFIASEPKQQYCSDDCKAAHERIRVARYRNDDINALTQRIGNLLRGRAYAASDSDKLEEFQSEYDSFLARKKEILKLYRSGTIDEDECSQIFQDIHNRYINSE